MAFRHLDRLPHVGDRVVIDDVALTVLNMDAHRISRVRVAKVSAEEDFEEMTEVGQKELTQEGVIVRSTDEEPVLEENDAAESNLKPAKIERVGREDFPTTTG